jgi:hypothetical protein
LTPGRSKALVALQRDGRWSRARLRRFFSLGFLMWLMEFCEAGPTDR